MVEADGATVQWGYGAAYRLTSETQTSPSGQVVAQTSYTHDGAGNRLSMTSGGQTTTYSYISLDHLTGINTGA